MKNEWISAHQAYRLVSKSTPFRAGEAICSRACDGIVQAKAHTLIWGNERREDCIVPAIFWSDRGTSVLTNNWATGDFETELDGMRLCRAYGVTFKRDQILAIVPNEMAAALPRTYLPNSNDQKKQPEPKTETPTLERKGGRPAAPYWDDLWIEICRALYAGELIPKKQSDVEKAMHDWLATKDQSAADSTVRARARKLWDAIND